MRSVSCAVWVWGVVLLSCAGPEAAQDLGRSRHRLEGDRAGLRSEVFAAPLSDVSWKMDERGVVTFWYARDGERVPYEKQYDGDVLAREAGEGLYQLWLERGRSLPPVELGYLDHGTLSICGSFEIAGQARAFGCEALFLHSALPPADGSRFPLIIGTSEGGSLRSRSGSAVIDLREFARPQINQYGTGTCYFNSSAGILEWFYQQQTGNALDISEPALLGSYTLGEIGDIGDYDLLQQTNQLPGAISDRLMPVRGYYTEDAGYEDVEGRASQEVAALPKSSRVDLPFALKLTNLFWYGRWQSGQTSEADFQRAVNWVSTREQPVHLQHVVSGYWHAVILLGYNPASGEVLIKDSLGNTNLKATWRTKKWFLDTTYGAVGVSLE